MKYKTPVQRLDKRVIAGEEGGKKKNEKRFPHPLTISMRFIFPHILTNEVRGYQHFPHFQEGKNYSDRKIDAGFKRRGTIV